MKVFKIALILIIGILLNSCASGYKLTNPNTINYISTNTNNGVTLDYKYNLLDKKVNIATRDIRRLFRVYTTTIYLANKSRGRILNAAN